MSTFVHTTERPKTDRGILTVRILTWVAVALFIPAFLLIPRGITVFWSMYFLFYGPAIAVALAATVGFAICRSTQRKISFAYLLICLAILAAVSYDTWFKLRLRWYEIF